MECFVGLVVQLDPAPHLRVANLDQSNAEHAFEVG
jgi:hypothetical protein